MVLPRLLTTTWPAVTSSLWAAKAARTSPFSRFGTLTKSRVRPSSAATSSNSAGEIRRSRWVSSRPNGVEPGQVLGAPFPQLRVLGILADHEIFHDGVAEVIDHRRDGEDAAQPLVQSFLWHGLLGLRVRVIRPRQYSHRGGGQRQPCDHASSCDSSQNSLSHHQTTLIIEIRWGNALEAKEFLEARHSPQIGGVAIGVNRSVPAQRQGSAAPRASYPADSPMAIGVEDPIDIGLSVREAARRIGCDPSRVRKLLKLGKLRGYRDGRRIRIRELSAVAYQDAVPIEAAGTAAASLSQRSSDRRRHSEALALLERLGVGSRQ